MSNRVILALLGTISVWWLTGWAAMPTISKSSAVALPQQVGLESIQRADVEGHRVCFDCHRSEVEAWQHSYHSSKAFELLRNEAAIDYAQKMDIRPADIAASSMCMDCHGTPRIDIFGRNQPIGGISCEACHNPSGGANGWLNAHAVYGPIGTTRQQETDEHYAMRAERCRQGGQIRSTDLYQMVKRCYACHVVSDEELVNKAQHSSFDADFEALNKMLGDVRHNFHVDQRNNAMVASLWITDSRHQGRTEENRKRMIYVVGQLVLAETVLRNLNRATDLQGNYASSLGRLLPAAYSKLENLECLSQVITEDLQTLIEDIDFGDVEAGDKRLSEFADSLADAAIKIAAGNGDELSEVELPPIAKDQLDKAYRH